MSYSAAKHSLTEKATSPSWWDLSRGEGCILATAIHDGHSVRPNLLAKLALAEGERLREEDPFTGYSISDIPNRLIAKRSRFEVDLNRAEEEAVYLGPDQAWGLDIWKTPLGDRDIENSRNLHRQFYGQVEHVLTQMTDQHKKIVMLDVHSYNHRRDGPDAVPTDPANAPDINIGTSSMPREQWAYIVDPLIEALGEFDFNGRKLDVRENVAFQGKGELTRFTHKNFPGQCCAIAFEWKKFFMDEWSGIPDPEELDAMRALINYAVKFVEGLLD